MEYGRPTSTTSEVPRITSIHKNNPEHQVDKDGVKTLAVELRWFKRGVREAIHIRSKRASLNKDGGHYNLPLSGTMC